ncbi:cysteine proteinase [Jackrogersella minutella]|nr:cysteine proteinase [Jackrogersella minutella]
MSSVAFTRTSVAPGTDTQSTATSAPSNDHVAITNGNGLAPGGNRGPGKAPFRHIDDLVSVGVDLDPHTPLRKVLELGDAHMRQAMTYHDFRRPDLALQEYIKAFTIAVDKVPRHKDFPSMKSDRGDLNRLYSALKTKITNNGPTFDKVKEDIKEENRQTGVQPTAPSKTSGPAPLISSHASPQAQICSSTELRKDCAKNEHIDLNRGSSVSDSSGSAGAGRRSKPPIQPKPQALHGNIIKPISSAPSEDLASRFARLRDSQRPVNPLKPVGLEESSLVHRTLPSVNTSMPAMPKLPEAIYSPARGTVTSEVANLPSSTPRGMFSRTNSITSTPSVSARTTPVHAIKTFNREQFVTAQTYQASQPSARGTWARVPEGDTITAKDLANLMNQNYPKVEILVIDVRDRQSFDEGHISYPRTICVEPEILMRENISADEIADSMVLAPSHERLAIEQRDKVDLVVIYDEDSTSVPTRITGNSLEMVLYNIRQALSHYSYSRPLKHSPKLLKGGLASWLNDFGELSLEVSDTISNHMPLSVIPTQKSRGIGRYRTKTKTLTQDEVNQFEDIIKADQTGMSEFDYVRTRDDFIRRYPSIAGAPESMASAADEELRKQEEDFLAGIAPAPPRRPAPTITRTRYSGLDSRDDDSDIGGVAMLADAGSAGGGQFLRTGLHNNGNSCYCNSTVQALLASPGFASEIIAENWPETWRVKDSREPARPQLLAKILKNLFDWMHKRQFEIMRPTTLMRYMRSVHEGFPHGDKIHKLGDEAQHDVDELTNFLFDQLGAETNRTNILVIRERPSPPPGSHRRIEYMVNHYWAALVDLNKNSFVDRHFLGFSVTERICFQCKRSTWNSDPVQCLYVAPGGASRSSGRPVTLTDTLNGWTAGTIDFDCRNCGPFKHRTRCQLLSLPRLLRVYIRRYVGASLRKQSLPFEFPETLDMTTYSWGMDTRKAVSDIIPSDLAQNFQVPTMYELYAIQVHGGTELIAGHYWSYVKGEGDTWIRIEDAHINVYNKQEWKAELQNLYQCSGAKTPVQLFYKRKDIPWEWDG